MFFLCVRACINSNITCFKKLIKGSLYLGSKIRARHLLLVIRGKQFSPLTLLLPPSLSARFLQRVNLIMSRFPALLLCLCHHTLGAADHLLIDGTFGFTIEANLLESFTGQGLLKGEEGGLGYPKNKAIH